MYSAPISTFVVLTTVLSLGGLYSLTAGSNVTKDTVCYDKLGCFENNSPWKSPLRPVPPPQAPEKIPTTVYFFSPQNTSHPYVIETYPDVEVAGVPIHSQKPTLVLIHGYNTDATEKWMKQLKDVYLNKVDANVFLVNWTVAPLSNYFQSASDTRVVGRVLSKFLMALVEVVGIKLEMVHIVGLSLGAHIASYAAKDTPGIGRLTALDPAQPLFENTDPRVRVDKTDANFVEVVHTDPKPLIPFLGVGMIAPYGHVDFYFNPGFVQPGCVVPDDIPAISSLADLVMFPRDYSYNQFFCSHERSHKYFVEAYNTTSKCIFWGHKASLHSVTKAVANGAAEGIVPSMKVRMKPCTPEDCVPFGPDAINTSLRGVFIVATNGKPPFCIGGQMPPPPLQTWNV